VDIEYIRDCHEAFMAKYPSFEVPISEIFTEKETDAEKPETDAELMEGVFGEIRSAAAQLDYEGIPALLQNFHVESLSKITVESGRENQ
jgi:hypothetical protein